MDGRIPPEQAPIFMCDLFYESVVKPTPNTYPVTSYTKKKMAAMFGWSRTTFLRRLKLLPNLNARKFDKILTPHDVQIIFEEYGVPLKTIE